MAYVVGHCRKVKSAVGLHNVAAHNCREGVYDAEWRAMGELPEWISHPERAAMNEGARIGGLAVLKNRTKRISAAKLIRKPPRNASAAVEVVISASPEWFESHSQKDWPGYFKTARDFLEKKFGPENVLHWATHYDETTPHMHVLFVPIVKSKTKKRGKDEWNVGNKYSAQEFLGDRDDLRKFQDDLAKMGKPFGLERGTRGSEARHTDQYGWAAETAVEREKLAMERGALDLRETELVRREKELAAEIARKEKALQEQSKRIGADLKKTAEISAATEAILDAHEGASLGRKFGTTLYGVPQSRFPEAWKVLETWAEKIRSEERARGSTRTRGPNERGGR